MFVAYRKGLRLLLDISPRTYNNFLHLIVDDLWLEVKLHKRVFTFIYNCLKGNSLSRMCAKIAANGSSSSVYNSVNILRQVYGTHTQSSPVLKFSQNAQLAYKQFAAIRSLFDVFCLIKPSYTQVLTKVYVLRKPEYFFFVCRCPS